jgi:hypothetical protein
MSLHGARWQAGTFDTGANSMVPPASVDGSMSSWRRGHACTRKGYFDKVEDEGVVQDAREHYEYRCLCKGDRQTHTHTHTYAHMHAYMCVCIYIYYVCIFIFTYLYLHSYIIQNCSDMYDSYIIHSYSWCSLAGGGTHIYTSIISIYLSIYMYIYIYIYMYTVCVCVFVCVCVYIHIYIHRVCVCLYVCKCVLCDLIQYKATLSSSPM